MQSTPRKAAFTRLVLKSARQFPKLMPQRLKHLAGYPPLDRGVGGGEEIARASLFYDPDNKLSLKGVNFVIEISGAELSCVQQWHRQDKFNWIDERHIDAIYSRGYLSYPRENIIGHVRFDGASGFQCVDKLNIGAKVFHGCMVSLVHLPSGSLYLNFYFWGGPVETSFVQSLGAAHLAPSIEFHGYNLFRRSSCVTWHFDRDGLAEQMVKKGLDSLKSEALRNLNALLKRMNIGIRDGRYIFKAWDFINDDNALRYPEDAVKRTVLNGMEREFFSVAFKPADFHEVKDDSIYLDLNDFDRGDYDLLSVRSKVFSSFTSDYERDQFKQSGNEVFGSLAALALTGSINEKVKQQLKRLEREIGYGSKVSRISSRQEVLFSVVEVLSKIKEELGEMKKYKTWVCPKPYMVLFEARIEGLSRLVEKLMQRADREYRFTTDTIGIKVVRSNNRFSWMLAIFAVVQIVLAYLAVDWEKVPPVETVLITLVMWFSSVFAQFISFSQDLMR